MWKPYSIYFQRKLDDTDVPYQGWYKEKTESEINLDPDDGTTLANQSQDAVQTSSNQNSAGTVQSSSQEAINNPSEYNGQYTNLMAPRNKAQRKTLRHMSFYYIDANTGKREQWNGGNKWQFNRLIKRQRNAINEKNLQSAEGQNATEGWNPVLAQIYNEMNSKWANDNYVTFTAKTKEQQQQEQGKDTPQYKYITSGSLSSGWNARNSNAITGLTDEQKKLLADNSGNITDASIKAFQTSKGFAADGKIGNQTLSAFGILPQNIPGVTPQGRVVRPVNWDTRNQAEYNKLNQTQQDLLGGYNMAAVKTFQTNHHLKADGIIGRQTLAKIQELTPSGDQGDADQGNADQGSSGTPVEGLDAQFVLATPTETWGQWFENNGFSDIPDELTVNDARYLENLINGKLGNAGQALDEYNKLSNIMKAYLAKKFPKRHINTNKTSTGTSYKATDQSTNPFAWLASSDNPIYNWGMSLK